MGADLYVRQGSFTSDEAASKGGRSEQDSAQLDAEFDAIFAAIFSHAVDIDNVLRDDGLLLDDILKGHEFSGEAISLLKGLIGNQNAALTWQGAWVTGSSYTAGDLVEDNGNAYICLVAHTASAAFATDVGLGRWDLFAQKGAGATFPLGAATDDVLYYNGAAEAWGKITAAMAPLHALINNTNLTGTCTAVNLTLSGALNLANGQLFNPGHYTMTGSATNPVFDFTRGLMQTFNVSAAIAGTTSTGRAAGRCMDIRFTPDSINRSVTWNANWVWLGAKPTQITASKSGLLTLRCYGANESDISATWSEVW